MLLNNNTGILICPNCGATENIIIDSDKTEYADCTFDTFGLNGKVLRM